MILAPAAWLVHQERAGYLTISGPAANLMGFPDCTGLQAVQQWAREGLKQVRVVANAAWHRGGL